MQVLKGSGDGSGDGTLTLTSKGSPRVVFILGENFANSSIHTVLKFFSLLIITVVIVILCIVSADFLYLILFLAFGTDRRAEILC